MSNVAFFRHHRCATPYLFCVYLFWATNVCVRGWRFPFVSFSCHVSNFLQRCGGVSGTFCIGHHCFEACWLEIADLPILLMDTEVQAGVGQAGPSPFWAGQALGVFTMLMCAVPTGSVRYSFREPSSLLLDCTQRQDIVQQFSPTCSARNGWLEPLQFWFWVYPGWLQNATWPPCLLLWENWVLYTHCEPVWISKLHVALHSTAPF